MVEPLKGFFRSKEQREWIRLFDQYGKTERYRPMTIPFLSYIFQVTDSLSFVWQFKDIFVDEIYKFETMKKSPVIYDCGANIGMSSIYFKRLYPGSKIKAFEADPQVVKILESNLSRSGYGDIEVINKAVWINNNGIEFSPDRSDGGSIYGKNGKIKVETLRLREWIEKEEEIDMLKIDIEGAEEDVIFDCKSSLYNIKNLFIEYHSWKDKDQKLGEILEIIQRNGFKYYLQTPFTKKTPFISAGLNSKMDLQINIFAWKPNRDLNA
ncbi:MAG: FkbM family methyltransferase [Nitrospinae bacterium]|nr:FkbM family methyltransferase [Nitrospinota bacterium]